MQTLVFLCLNWCPDSWRQWGVLHVLHAISILLFYSFQCVILLKTSSKRFLTLPGYAGTKKTNVVLLLKLEMQNWDLYGCKALALWGWLTGSILFWGTERDPWGTERDPLGTERDPWGTERDPWGTWHQWALADRAELEFPHGPSNFSIGQDLVMGCGHHRDRRQRMHCWLRHKYVLWQSGFQEGGKYLGIWEMQRWASRRTSVFGRFWASCVPGGSLGDNPYPKKKTK